MSIAYHNIYDFFFSGHMCLTAAMSYYLLAVHLRRGHNQKVFTIIHYSWGIGMILYVAIMMILFQTHYIIDLTAGYAVAIIFGPVGEKLSYFPDRFLFGFKGHDRYFVRYKPCPRCGWANDRALNHIDEEEKRAQAMIYKLKQDEDQIAIQHPERVHLLQKSDRLMDLNL